MGEDYCNTQYCPVCGNKIFNSNDQTHFTSCKFKSGSDFNGENFWSEHTKYCHIGNAFVLFILNGGYYQVTKLTTNDRFVKNIISNVNKKQSNVILFITNYILNQKNFTNINKSGQYKLINNVDNMVNKLIYNYYIKRKPLYCKFGLHQYVSTDFEILLICSKCHNIKIDWKKVPIFNMSIGKNIV